MTEVTTAMPPAAAGLRFGPVFAAALGVRVATLLLGIALGSRPPDPYQDPRTPHAVRDEIGTGSARLAEAWFRFDADWYLRVARDGYAGAVGDTGRNGTAFLPALPLVFAAADTLGLNRFWAGLLVVNLAGAAAVTGVVRLAERLTGRRDTAWRTFGLLNAFPSAFFLSAPYNESLGLLFTALALNAWLDGRTVRAGLYAGLGSLARLTGVAPGLAALSAWLADDRSRAGLTRAAVLAAGSLGGLALFWAYLGWAVGDPLAGLRSHQAWGRRPLALANPWYAIESIYDPEVPHWGEAFLVLGSAGLGVRAWRKRGSFWGVLTLVPVGQILLSGTFLSGHRLVLAAVPAFVELADLLRNRLLFGTTAVAFGLAQFVLLNRFVHWQFAG